MNKLSLWILILLTLSIINEKSLCQSNTLSIANYFFDIKDYKSSINAYQEVVVNENETVKNRIYALNQIAGIYFDINKDYQSTLETYNLLVLLFPQTREAKQSLFMTAFTYDEYLKDKEKAIFYYEIFLLKYPYNIDKNDKMSDSARTNLAILKLKSDK